MTERAGLPKALYSTNADGVGNVFAADVDGDGDTDVLATDFWGDEITWYENRGVARFTRRTISTGVDGPAV